MTGPKIGALWTNHKGILLICASILGSGTAAFCADPRAGMHSPGYSEPAPEPSQLIATIPTYASRFQRWQKPGTPREIVATLRDEVTRIAYNLYRHEDENLVRLVEQGQTSNALDAIWWQAVLGLSDGVVLYQEGDRVGFATLAGRKIGATYTSAGMFSDGLAAVAKDSSWGFIDGNGTQAISYRFEDVGHFQNGVAPAQIDRLWGYIDKNGEIVIKPEFESAPGVENGQAKVVLNGKIGKIYISNLTNQTPIEAKSSDIEWSETEQTNDEQTDDASIASGDTSNLVHQTSHCRLREGFTATKAGEFNDSVYKMICAALMRNWQFLENAIVWPGDATPPSWIDLHVHPVNLVFSAQIFPIKTIDSFGTSLTAIDVVSDGCRNAALVRDEEIVWGRNTTKCLGRSADAPEPASIVVENGSRTGRYMLCEASRHLAYSVSLKPELWDSSATVCYPERDTTRCGTYEPEQVLQRQCSSAQRGPGTGEEHEKSRNVDR